MISACVITYNEAGSIERCLKSLAFADEIVVVDANSTDGTLEIVRKYTPNVISNAWHGFTVQRNVGLSHCKGNWVFFLDADECVTPSLASELRRIDMDRTGQHPNCYSVKRIEYFLGKELHYGPGNPSFQWRFFKRTGVRFEGDVHEYPRFEGGIGTMHNVAILHNPDLGVERFLGKLNHYTTLEALDRFAQGQRTSLWHAIGTFFTTILKNGIRYRGFLNGKEGFVLILLEAFSRVVRHLKLWTYWQVYDGKVNIKLPVPLPKPGSATAPKREELEKHLV